MTELARPAAIMELLPTEVTSTGTSPFLNSSDSNLGNEGLETSEQSPLSESEELVELYYASVTSAGTSPILDSSDDSLSNEGLETKDKSKPLSEKEELAALRE